VGKRKQKKKGRHESNDQNELERKYVLGLKKGPV
jgi:hypothetical protein